MVEEGEGGTSAGSGKCAAGRGTTADSVPERCQEGPSLSKPAGGARGAEGARSRGQASGRSRTGQATTGPVPRWSSAGQAAGVVSHEPSACEPVRRSRGPARWANRDCPAQKRWPVLAATRCTWTCDLTCTLTHRRIEVSSVARAWLRTPQLPHRARRERRLGVRFDRRHVI